MSEATAGQRVYRIRLDLGDGWKTPMPMEAFAALLNKKGKTTLYDSSKISRMESGDRKVSIDEVPLIASVDPKGRGRDWLAWGDTEPSDAKPRDVRQGTGTIVAGRGAPAKAKPSKEA